MNRQSCTLALALPLALLAASEQTWKDKDIAQWTEEDAKQVLTDSPWAHQAALTVSRKPDSRPGRGGGMGRGGIAIGLPGIGIGTGRGRRGGGYPPRDGEDRRRQPGRADEPQSVTVRWESAFPVQEAHLKTKDSDSPSVDESQYAIVVEGLPGRMNGSQMSEKDLKGQAELRKDGRKFMKPSNVRVISRDQGVMVIYYFPRSKEITRTDQEVVFVAHLGHFELSQSYSVPDMVYKGKLEL